MSAVILIRHAMPEVVQGTSSKFWGLSEAAREDCVMLAHALPAGLASPIWSSDERKARETAEVLGLRLGLDVPSIRGSRKSTGRRCGIAIPRSGGGLPGRHA